MFTRAILISLLLSATVAQLCPPAAELHPCTCDEDLKTIACQDIPDEFDIKAVFDRASPFVNESSVFQQLTISGTSLFEIPEDAITSLKFRIINIESNENLAYISPKAFRDTLPITTQLLIRFNPLNTTTPSERDIFEVCSQFVNVQLIDLMGGLTITTIPDHAFSTLRHLKQLILGFTAIQSIGNFAFSELTGLQLLLLGYSQVTDTGIASDAFTGAHSTLNVDLSFNEGITYLEEQGFRSMLTYAQTVTVGGTICNPIIGCYTLGLACDSRADWICGKADEFKPKINGFFCTNNHEDIWAYCDSLSKYIG